MPRIPQYSAETSAQGQLGTRQATPADFGGDMGLQSLGQDIQHSVGIVEQRQTEDDVTNVRVAMAKAGAEWDVQFRDEAAKAPAGDSQFAERFTQKFTDYVGKTRGIAQTRKGQATFDLLAANLTGHFAEKAGAFQAHSIGVKAKLDHQELLNALGSRVFNDPLSFRQRIQEGIEATQDGRYARLDANTRREFATDIKDHLAQKYIEGLIVRGGEELARQELLSGRMNDLIKSDSIPRLIHQADTAITTKRVLADYMRAAEDRAVKTDQEALHLSLVSRIISPTDKNGGVPSTAEIVMAAGINPKTGRPGLSSTQVENVNGLIFSQARNLIDRTENKPNPEEETRLTLQLYASPDDPDKSYTIQPAIESLTAGRINQKEFDRINQRVNQLRDGSTNTFAHDLNRAVNSLERLTAASPTYIGDPAKLNDSLLRLRRDTETMSKAYREAGKDPRLLLNPANKESPFHIDNIQTYLESPTQSLVEKAGIVRKQSELSTKPSAYDSAFAAAAKKYGLDAGELKRLAITESMLNPKAVNNKDANGGSIGLMQVNLQHAAEFNVTREQLMDPAKNIDIGAQLWKRALDQAKGDRTRAVDLYKGATSAAGRANIAPASRFITSGGKMENVRPITAAPGLPTAVNPITGETLVLRDGKWQKP